MLAHQSQFAPAGVQSEPSNGSAMGGLHVWHQSCGQPVCEGAPGCRLAAVSRTQSPDGCDRTDCQVNRRGTMVYLVHSESTHTRRNQFGNGLDRRAHLQGPADIRGRLWMWRKSDLACPTWLS